MSRAAVFLLVLLAASPAWAGDKIIYISPNPLGVNEYLKMGRKGIEEAGRQLGITAKTFESSDPESRTENVAAAVGEGAGIVVVMGFEFADIIADAALDYPAVKFLIVDQCTPKPPPNLYCVTFKEQEANFLAGAEAALTSKAGKVGSVAATDIPYLHRYSDAFAAGARQARPDIAIHPTLWVGGDTAFSDPLRAQSQAAALLADGVDRVFAVAAAGNGGVFKAVAAAPGALATGIDVNQCPSSPGRILDSAIKHSDLAIVRAIKGIRARTQPQIAAYGLKEGGVDLIGLEPGVETSQCVVAGFPAVIARLRALKDAIKAGSLKVRDPMVMGP